MTNIEYNDYSLLSQNERKIYNPKNGWNVGRDIKGWIYGHNMVKDMNTINVTGYITKYMTKDIDNRLFGRHRYFYSQNLKKPETILLNLNSFQDKSLYEMLDTFYYDFNEMTYSKTYKNLWDEPIIYVEYKGNYNRSYKLSSSDNIYYVKFLKSIKILIN